MRNVESCACVLISIAIKQTCAALARSALVTHWMAWLSSICAGFDWVDTQNAAQPKVMLFTKKSEPTALYKGVALNYMDILPVSNLTETILSFLACAFQLFCPGPRRRNARVSNISTFLTCLCLCAWSSVWPLCQPAQADA
jgi:hypothetical protein